MRVVVTGGMGFIGTSVVRRLLSMGHEVVMVDHVEQQLRAYEKAGLPILREVYHNLRDCVDALEPYELLVRNVLAATYVHLGACVDTRKVPDDLFEKNIRYVRLLADELPYNSRVVYASSAAVYGTEGFPCNAYGMSKRLGENMFRASSHLQTTVLRFFNVYGRYEHHKGDMASVPFKIARAYTTGGRFGLFCPDASRDFISVDQVTDAVVGHALEDDSKTRGFQVFDVGTGYDTSFGGLDDNIQTALGATTSACDLVEMPVDFKGHYQFYTRAGTNSVQISPYIGSSPDILTSLRDQFYEKD